jgi:serine/threonine protein kinase
VRNRQGHSPAVQQGQILAERYRVERVLADWWVVRADPQGPRSRDGVLVAAHHLQRNEKVTLSLFLAADDEAAVYRFQSNARAVAHLKGEHVVRINDVGALSDGTAFVEMEPLDGEDLAVWLQRSGALPVEQAVEVMLQVCVAVAQAHALGIVHRALEPANLFCVPHSDGQLSVKVLDFGASMTRTATFSSSPLTGLANANSARIGTRLYASPEQWHGPKNVDARADIWAIGAILFELMTGRPVFQADSLAEAAFKTLTEPAPGVRTIRSAVPGELEAVLLKCLEKDRAKRYQNVGELASALLPFASERAKASAEFR